MSMSPRQLFHCECLKVIGTSDSDPITTIATKQLVLLLTNQVYIEGTVGWGLTTTFSKRTPWLFVSFILQP